MIESKQNIKFPKFAEILKSQYEFNLILIPLNRIKKVSYNIYFGRQNKVNDDIKNLKNEIDNKVCKSLIQPSSLFCLLNEETIINIYL